MSSYCEDCGCTTNNGVCSNCQEELYIFENQNEFMVKPMSEEFEKKVIEQRN